MLADINVFKNILIVYDDPPILTSPPHQTPQFLKCHKDANIPLQNMGRRAAALLGDTLLAFGFHWISLSLPLLLIYLCRVMLVNSMFNLHFLWGGGVG